jgi:hypothetical protein
MEIHMKQESAGKRRHYLRFGDGREMWEDDKRIVSIDGQFLKIGDTIAVHYRTNGDPPFWYAMAMSVPPPRDLLAEVEKAIDNEAMDPRICGQPWGVRAQDIDPHGIPQHAPGAKLDAEKPRVGLVMDGFALALLEVAKVGTYGAKKYSDNGWMSVDNGEQRYKDAMLRHALQASQEERDAESGLLHLAQAAWNSLATLQKHLETK